LSAARPRFGFSVFGIACVVGAIALFGSRSSNLLSQIGMAPPILVSAVVLVSSYALLRDWRRSLAVCLSAVLPVLVGLWALARLGATLEPPIEGPLLVAVSIGLLLQLSIAREAGGAIVTQDDAVAGSERAMELQAMPVCVASLAGTIAIVMFIIGAPDMWIPFSVATLAAALSTILFQPAIAITIESLIPRAATIAARYRIK
jgi:hypothetical protein